jgi:ribonucleoside-triphosphate reductase
MEEERTKCEVFTRCVGYLRPINQFNAGKKSEYYDRTPYEIEKELPKED